VVFRSSKYHHQYGGIPNTVIRLFLLYHWSIVDERDPSILYNLFWHFAHELHYLKVGIPQKWHYELQDIITRVVAFHTHNLSQSSCIMAQGQMEGIHLFCITFPGSLPMNYTTFELGHLPRGGMRKKRIPTPAQWHCKQNKTFLWLPLNNWSMTDERDPSILYNLSGQLTHELHYFKLGHLPRSGIMKLKISSPIWWHSKHSN
jgi:hypothetical protein